MNSLVIGAGEIGTSLHDVLSAAHSVDIRDVQNKRGLKRHYTIVHITFGYFAGFETAVLEYEKKYKPNHLIIHSTVPVGTTELINEDVGANVYHSPVRGMHPDLQASLITFVKFISGVKSDEITKYFNEAKISLDWSSSWEATELGKLISTTYYGMCIAFAKDVQELCSTKNIDFDTVYTKFNETYNLGYIAMGKNNVIRPTLKPVAGGIGGHCVQSNAAILHADGLLREITEYVMSFGQERVEGANSTVWQYCERYGKNRSLKDVITEDANKKS